MEELTKPREEQALTVDHVLEATRGASALAKRGVITDEEGEEELRRAVVDKFKSQVATSTVEPRCASLLSQDRRQIRVRLAVGGRDGDDLAQARRRR